MTQLTREQLDILSLHPVLSLITECGSACAQNNARFKYVLVRSLAIVFVSHYLISNTKKKKKREKKKGVEDDEEKTQLRHLQCNDVGVSPTYITAPFVSSPSNIDTLQKITSEKQQQQQQQQQNPACVLLDYISASFAFISVSMLLKVVKWNVSMVEIIIVGISFCFICNVHDFFVFVGFLSF